MDYEQAVERRRSSVELALGNDPRYANTGGDATQYESTATYFDEEDLLGFKIWVAELELLVGKSKRNYKEDAGACYRLLQKLHATLDRTAVSELKEYQRRCEDALVDILLRGMPPPIRRLICSSLAKMYGKGDTLPLFSRVSSLQLFLGTREAFGSQTAEDVRLGAMELMTSLYYSHGRSLSVGVLESASIGSKYCSKSCSDGTRQAALRLLAATVEGVGDQHREAALVLSEAVKCTEKILKEKNIGKPVKLGVADLLRAVSATGTAQFWLSSSAHFTIRSACLNGIRDESTAIRAAFARALGELVAALVTCRSVDTEDTKGSKTFEESMQDVPEEFLSSPLAEAMVSEDRKACFALSQAWVWYLTHVKLFGELDDPELVELARLPYNTLGVASLTATALNPEKGPPGPDHGLGTSISNGERPYAQACTLYIVRAGIVEQLGEFGQKELLQNLSNDLHEDAPAPVLITKLESISLLIDALGEIGPEAADTLEKGIAKNLVHRCGCVRRQAAATLAALCVAEAGRAARLIGSALNALKNAADALADVSSVSDKSRPLPGTPRGPGSNKIRPEINALNGWSLAVSCMLSALTCLPLGIPSHYLKVASQICFALIEAPRSEHQGAQSSEREAGYNILGALCTHSLGLIEEVYGESLLGLWKPLFEVEAIRLMETLYAAKEEYALAAELWWRCEALHAFGSYIQNVNIDSLDCEPLSMFEHILENLKNCKALSQPALQQPRSGHTALQSTAALYQTRILRLFNLVPTRYWISNEKFSLLLEMCMEGLSISAQGLSSFSGLENALMVSLDPADEKLGPWNIGKDMFERELLYFRGSSGGIEDPIWTMRVKCSMVPGEKKQNKFSPYPQAISIQEALFNVRVSILSKFISKGEHDQRALLVNTLCEWPTLLVKKDKSGDKRRTIILIASMPFLISNITGSVKFLDDDDLSERIKGLALALAAESSHGILFQRAASDLFAMMSRASSDVAANHLITELCQNSVSTSSLSERATFILALGSISRVLGGIGLASVLPILVDTLKALAKASSSSISWSIANSLTIIGSSAGPAYINYVAQTLEIAESMLLSDEIYSAFGLLPAIGRLGNAMVACLGPDFVLGSKAYDICRSIVFELRAPDSSGVRLKEDILSAALESVLYAQMLVLFAPLALPTSQHIQVLVATLPSRQPQLRRAAARTLRHLSERDTSKVLNERIEPALLAALDGETDSATEMQLRASLLVLLRQGAAKEPSRWIKLLGGVAASTPISGEQSNGLLSSEQGEEMVEDLMSQGEEGVSNPKNCKIPDENLTPRLKTRIFAAQCLNEIPELASSSDIRHTDALAAQNSNDDLLVKSAKLLIDTGFKMASGDMDGLRACGVQLLLNVLRVIGDSKDPFLADELLLYQYQAQYVSALRSSLSSGASPAVNAAGAALAAVFLEKGIAGNDSVVMERLLSLLCEPLSLWASGAPDSTQSAYAEWVAAGARVALLESHAICACLGNSGDKASYSSSQDIVKRAQGPFFTILVECWTGLMEDTIVLLLEDPAHCTNYTLRLYGRLGSSKSPRLKDAFRGINASLRRTWPKIVDAASTVLLRDRTVSHGNTGRERHASLFEITVAFSHIQSDFLGDVAILKSLSRLTESRYIKEGWLSHQMIEEATLITESILQKTDLKSTEGCLYLNISSLILSNVLEASLKRQDAGKLPRKLEPVLKCIEHSYEAKPALDKNFSALQKALQYEVENSYPIEDVSFTLYHSLTLGLAVLMSKDTRSSSTDSACSHLIAISRMLHSQISKLNIAASIDPDIPSVDSIVSFCCRLGCKIVLREYSNSYAKSLSNELAVMLHLGSLAQINVANTANGIFGDFFSDSQGIIAKCVLHILRKGPPEMIHAVFLGSLDWLQSADPSIWRTNFSTVLFPFVLQAIYQFYRKHLPSSTIPLEERIGKAIELSTCIVETSTSESAMKAFIPLLVLMTSQSKRSQVPLTVSDTSTSNLHRSIAEDAMKSLLKLASGPCASTFKTIILTLPENQRKDLQDALKSSTAASKSSKGNFEPTQRKTSSGPKLQQAAFDLSRFT